MARTATVTAPGARPAGKKPRGWAPGQNQPAEPQEEGVAGGGGGTRTGAVVGWDRGGVREGDGAPAEGVLHRIPRHGQPHHRGMRPAPLDRTLRRRGRDPERRAATEERVVQD